MTCGPKTLRLGGSAWTLPSEVTETFVPFSGTLSAADYESMRATLELRDVTGDIKIKRGVVTSDDGVSWNTPVAFDTPTWLTAEGFDYPTQFTTITATARYFRIGILALNQASGGKVEQIRVNMSLDLKAR